MSKVIALALLAAGILLLILGINAYNSTSSDISRFFSGSPSDRSIWLLVGGGVGIIAGMVGLGRKPKSA